VTAPAAKALLVDDRRENLVALEAILQGLPVETVSVTSGEAALKQLLGEEFAVILLDASMPTMDGFETATHIKQRERTRHIPIIFLTALNYDARLAFRGYQIGAVDYITKPFDPWVLRSKVAVFVDLWLKNAELTARAAEHTALRDAVTNAIALLRATPPDPVSAAEILEAARTRP
jgi:CheY-like chemotaxis protein